MQSEKRKTATTTKALNNANVKKNGGRGRESKGNDLDPRKDNA